IWFAYGPVSMVSYDLKRDLLIEIQQPFLFLIFYTAHRLLLSNTRNGLALCQWLHTCSLSQTNQSERIEGIFVAILYGLLVALPPLLYGCMRGNYSSFFGKV
ncbi:hypothetical protein THRCLA_06656, partial [Thraustotheca clavata]